MIDILITLYTNPQKVLVGVIAYFAFAAAAGLVYFLWSKSEAYATWLNTKSSLARWTLYIPLNFLFFAALNLIGTIAIELGAVVFFRDYKTLIEIVQYLTPYLVPIATLPTLLYLIWKTSPIAPRAQIGICVFVVNAICFLGIAYACLRILNGTADSSLVSEAFKAMILAGNATMGLRYYLKYSENERENHPLNYIRWFFEVGNTNPKIEHTAKVLTKEISA